MIKKITGYIEYYRLLPDRAKVIVGLSGGADSVALLHLLSRLGYHCVAAHCNFRLRGEESERDEIFACDFAGKLNVTFEKINFGTHGYARENKLSIEMAARELRYNWFAGLREKHNAQAIAVAHHRDDNVETILLNLIRGCSIKGLTGMAPKNGFIVRPLLNVSRREIEEYLKRENLPFVTDSTNTDTVYLRNAVRRELLPLLEKYNPSVREALLRMATNLKEVEKIYDDAIDKGKMTVMPTESVVDISKLLQQPSPEALLYSILEKYRFSPTVIQTISRSLDAPSGKVFYSPSHKVVKDRTRLLITEKKEQRNEIYTIEYDLANEHLPLKISFRKEAYTGQTLKLERSQQAVFDFDALSFPLTLRRWQKGDFFVPLGMTGKQKISDYFSDHKFSLPAKERAWLLCSNGEDIIWIVGERSDNRFKVTKKTRNLLYITVY